jgi:Tol biopolymer transport system component
MADEIRLTEIGWESGPADWSPDGRRLVFSSWERGGTPGVGKPWIVTIDPSTGRPLGVAPLRLPDTIKSAEWVAWSPKGNSLAIEEATREGRHSLWTIRADGSSPHKIVEYDIKTYGGVAWTPDRTDLVYAALVDDHTQIFSVPAEGGTPKQLTHDGANLLHPRVSPDGRWIAVTRLLVTKEIWRRKLP